MSFGFGVNESNFRTLSTGIPFVFAYFTIFNENIQSLCPTILTCFALFYAALECLRPDTKYAAAYYQRGTAKHKLQDFTGAIQDYSKAIELDPKYAAAYYLRGFAKEMLKDKFGALADYSKAGELGITSAYEQIQRIQKGQ